MSITIFLAPQVPQVSDHNANEASNTLMEVCATHPHKIQMLPILKPDFDLLFCNVQQPRNNNNFEV